MPIQKECAPKLSLLLGKTRSDALKEAIICLQNGQQNAVDLALKELHAISYTGLHVDNVKPCYYSFARFV